MSNTSNMKKTTTWLAICLTTLFFLSCEKTDFSKLAGITWNPDLAAPIGYADFDVYDILAAADSTDLIVVNKNTGEIALTYNSEIASFGAASILNLPIVNENYALTLPDLGLTAGLPFSGTISESNTEYLPITIDNNAEIFNILLKSGNLDLNVSTNLRHDVELTAKLLDIKKGGVIQTKKINLKYNNSIPQTGRIVFDLTDCMADFTANGTKTNTIRIQFDSKITGTGAPISPTDDIQIDLDLNSMNFSNATGYFGQQPLANAMDTIDIKVFNKNETKGIFHLENPSLTFFVDNSFGIPADINFGELKTVNRETNEEFKLTGFDKKLTLKTPTKFGDKAQTTLKLDKTNIGNGLTSILSPTPKIFVYDLSADANPAGKTATPNFITDSSKIVIRADLLLPLEGYAYDFRLTDTIPFGLDYDVKMIESAMFRLNVLNGFPIELNADVVMMDENYKPLFKLLNNQNLVDAAPVDATGRVKKNGAVKKISDIELTAAQRALLNKVKYIELTGAAQTTTPQKTTVKFYDDYTFSLKLGFQAKLKANI